MELVVRGYGNSLMRFGGNEGGVGDGYNGIWRGVVVKLLHRFDIFDGLL